MITDTLNYIPKRCVYEATLACNLKCRHCGSSAGKPRNVELSTDQAKDMFVQLAELGCERITISGGEPLMRPDWAELIQSAAKTKMRVGLITNGLAFDLDAARLAKDSGLNSVGFSIDGPREIHDHIRARVGHFNRIILAMAAARDAQLPFAVVSFVHAQNLHRLEEMFDFIADQGAFAWQVQLGTDMGNLHSHPELLIAPCQLIGLQQTLARLIRRRTLRIDVSDSIGYFGPEEKLLRSSTGTKVFGGCGAGMRVVGIESNGNVKGCLSIMAGYNERGKDFVEGNILERRLADIWHDPEAFAYNRKWTLEGHEGYCKSCPHVQRCRGGCRAKRAASGQVMDNPMCAYRIIIQDQVGARRAGTVAAAALVATLGVSTLSCADTIPIYGAPMYDAPMDTDTGTDTDTDSSLDAGVDAGADTDTTDTATATPEYAVPQPTPER